MINDLLNLKNGFNFDDLLTTEGIKRLDHCFLTYLNKQDTELHAQLLAYRNTNISEPLLVSQLILLCAPLLEKFIAELFSIEREIELIQEQTLSHDPIFKFKKHFILRLAKRRLNQKDAIETFSQLDQWLSDQLMAWLALRDSDSSSDSISKDATHQDRELNIATFGLSLLEHEANTQIEMSKLTDWCVAAMSSEEGKKAVANWAMFILPLRLDFNHLVKVIPVADDPFLRLQGPTFRYREGFDLTDSRMSRRQAMSEVHYCIYCHDNEGDFCSKGFPVKKMVPDLGFKMNPVNELLTGCPLEQKISEMHLLKKAGYAIASLAVIMIDNPMCPATGHRICNDCMKACIYQKQEPVNIPQTETRILTDVLDLPWGVEIYSLLTRWNPLRSKQWSLKAYNGLKVLIMGMGPAGFTLAHHLLMEGFAVVGADGLKIEPLSSKWIHQPIFNWQELEEKLSDRVVSGFGGVAEYGITVRWDKNFLKLIYITLVRHHYFQVFGSVRFGGTITVEDAWTLGFDHLAVAVGAGLPKEINIPNSIAPGMRQANDFLMALQLTGASKQTSLANLQVRMPAVIIGGGLTGVDTATEVQAYYIIQVEKMAARYNTLVTHFGKAYIRSQFNQLNLIILDEFLQHAEEIYQERQLAIQEKRQPDLVKLLRRWGGVTIAYRRGMVESPAYRRNPEELSKALEEGIYYAEGLEPRAVILDAWGQVKGIQCRWRVYDEDGNWHQTNEEQVLPARSIFVATGAKLNVAYEFEHRGTFSRKHAFEYNHYELVEEQLQLIENVVHVKSPHFGPFTSYQKQHHVVSFLGDTHPVFHGSVVKAIASAKHIYPFICKALASQFKQGDETEYRQFREQLNHLFKAEVVSVKSLAPSVIELVLNCPLAASQYRSGQFYRLQNYELQAKKVNNTKLQLEGLALLAIPTIDRPESLTFIIFAEGVSSRLVKYFRPLEPVALMGPTGAYYDEPATQYYLIIGGSMAAIHVLSIAREKRVIQPKILFIAYFQSNESIFYQEELEAVATVVWVKLGEASQNMPQQSEWIYALQDYSSQNVETETETKKTRIELEQIDQILIIGSSALLRSVKAALSSELQGLFSSKVTVSASVYGPMQCMLKGVCAQCLQWQINPTTGERTKAVYACSWQQQPLQKIDIDHIDQRLMQNQCQEILSNIWLDYLEEKIE